MQPFSPTIPDCGNLHKPLSIDPCLKRAGTAKGGLFKSVFNVICRIYTPKNFRSLLLALWLCGPYSWPKVLRLPWHAPSGCSSLEILVWSPLSIIVCHCKSPNEREQGGGPKQVTHLLEHSLGSSSPSKWLWACDSTADIIWQSLVPLVSLDFSLCGSWTWPKSLVHGRSALARAHGPSGAGRSSCSKRSASAFIQTSSQMMLTTYFHQRPQKKATLASWVIPTYLKSVHSTVSPNLRSKLAMNITFCQVLWVFPESPAENALEVAAIHPGHRWWRIPCSCFCSGLGAEGNQWTYTGFLPHVPQSGYYCYCSKAMNNCQISHLNWTEQHCCNAFLFVVPTQPPLTWPKGPVVDCRCWAAAGARQSLGCRSARPGGRGPPVDDPQHSSNRDFKNIGFEWFLDVCKVF